MMLEVQILINGRRIFLNRAVRREKEKPHPQKLYTYDTGDGRILKHRYADGAKKLAKKLLDVKDA